MENSESKGSFWSTLPGMLTGLGGLLTAVTGLLVALHQFGVIGSRPNAALAPTAAVSKPPARREPAGSAGSLSQSAPGSPSKPGRKLAPVMLTSPAMSIYYAAGEPTVGRGPLYSEAGRTSFLSDFRSRGPDAVVMVIGYAYREGDRQAMGELSRQRAEGVRKYLEKVGIPPDQVRAAGHGEKDPTTPPACAADEGSDACAGARRRVDLIWSSWLTGN